jgi:hypothetical protein
MSKAYFLGGPMDGHFIDVPDNAGGYLAEVGGEYVRRELEIQVGFYRLKTRVFLSVECATTADQHEAALGAVIRQASEELGTVLTR